MYEKLRNIYIELSPEEEKVNAELSPKEFRPIVDLFREDLGQELWQIYIHENRLFIKGFDGENQNDLMLRFGDDVSKRLTIARVSFINQRQGNMTRLMDILTEIAIKEGYESIEMEAVISDAMMNFCDKNGFVACPFADLREVYKPVMESNYRYKHLV